MNTKLFSAIAILVGTIIGAGIFGIPYVVSKVGFLPGLIYLILLGIFTLLVTLSYGETILRTKDRHQMTGYASRYLGKWGRRILSFTLVFSIYGALLAYMIGVGDFLNTIFSPWLGGTPFLYSLIFFIFGSAIIYFGLKTIVSVERIMFLIVLAVALVIFIFGLNKIEINNFLTFDKAFLFLPYGVILFAFAGATAVVDMRQVLKGNEQKLKKGILFGYLFPFIIYLLFVITVVGISGKGTSEEAVRGLGSFLGNKILILGAILGVLTMTTSFFNLGLVLKEIFIFDYKFSKNLSWFIVAFVPFVIFLLGLTNFIKVIGLVGSIVGGVDGIMILLMHKKAKKLGDRKPEFSINIPHFVYYLLFLVFGLGISYEIWFSFFSGKI